MSLTTLKVFRIGDLFFQHCISPDTDSTYFQDEFTDRTLMIVDRDGRTYFDEVSEENLVGYFRLTDSGWAFICVFSDTPIHFNSTNLIRAEQDLFTQIWKD